MLNPYRTNTQGALGHTGARARGRAPHVAVAAAAVGGRARESADAAACGQLAPVVVALALAQGGRVASGVARTGLWTLAYV